jgi:glycosyltransferase involved in cell wall biosynthesis
MAGELPLVSLVIPCRNESDHIRAALDSILAQQKPPGGVEIIVADGMSSDGTREELERLVNEACDQRPEVGGRRSTLPATRLRIIDNPGRIASTGLNAAIRAAIGEIIIRMDCHTEYAEDYILSCVEVLQQAKAENVGGPARTKCDTFLMRAIAAAYHSPFSVGGARFHDPDYEGYVDTVTYGCWRKDTFEKFGYFDEELVRNQDDEHNLRIVRGGGKIYQSPKIKSWYKPRGSLTALFKQYLQYGYWKVRVVQKHKLPASWRHLVPGTFVLSLAVLFLLSVLCPLSSALVPAPWPIVCGRWSALALFVLLSAYLVALGAASVHTAAKAGWKLLPLLPLVFPCYHFGYGIGFLRGVWDFVIRRKGAHKCFETLTR